MMRKLTDQEIERLANRDGAKSMAVKNFLKTVAEDNDLIDLVGDLGIDGKIYNWNKETIRAIMEGIFLASGV